MKENHFIFWILSFFWLIASICIWYYLFIDQEFPCSFTEIAEKIKCSGETGQTLGYFMGAFGVGAIGLVVLGRRTHTTMQQTENDGKKLINENFTKSIELLGHEKVSARQGGIFSLKRLLTTDELELYKTIINIFASFVRDRSNNWIIEEIKSKLPEGEIKHNIRHNIRQKIKNEEKENHPCLQLVSFYNDIFQTKNDQESKENECPLKVARNKLPSLPVDIEASLSALHEQETSNEEKWKKLLEQKDLSAKKAIDLSNSFIINFDFNKGNFTNFDFSDCIFINCSFQETNLTETILTASVFIDCDFSKSGEFKDEFKDEFKGANFNKARLSDCTFFVCTLNNVKGLTKVQKDKITEATKDGYGYTTVTL